MRENKQQKSIFDIFSQQLFVLFLFTIIIAGGIYLSQQTQKNTYHPSHAQELNAPFELVKVEDALVDNFPRIPIYPNVDIDDSLKKRINNENGYEAEWHSTDSISDVLNFYITELPKDGWIIDFIPENFQAEETQIIAHKNGQKLYLMVEFDEVNHDLTEIVAEFPLH